MNLQNGSQEPPSIYDTCALPDFVEERAKQGLRWPKLADIYQLKFSNVNGFNRCLRKLGRKLLISRSAFEQWISNAPIPGDRNAK